MDSPPIPNEWVKSPPWAINPGIILWKLDPLKWSGFPYFPTPFSPVHKALKFSTVFGTVSPKSPKTILPYGYPSISTSKKTFLVTVSRVAAETKAIAKLYIIILNILFGYNKYLFFFHN